MKVVSISILVYLETEKRTCYATWFDVSSNRELWIYANKKLFIVSWLQNCEKMPKEIHQNSKIKTDQQQVERRNLFYFENTLFITIFLVKQQTNLVKTWWEDEGGKGRGRGSRGDNRITPILPFCLVGRLNLLTNFQKKGLDSTSIFRGDNLFQGVTVFTWKIN